MNKSKNKNTPNPTYLDDIIDNKRSSKSHEGLDRENAIENIRKSNPTKR